MRSRIISIFISTLLLLEPSRAIAGDVPVSVPGKSQSPKCQTSSNANSTAKSSVTKSASKACQAGDGLSQESAGSSAWQIKRDYPNSSSGLYWIKNTSINGGVPFQIYADMATDNGGWTLIVANSIFGWNSSEAFSDEAIVSRVLKGEKEQENQPKFAIWSISLNGIESPSNLP